MANVTVDSAKPGDDGQSSVYRIDQEHLFDFILSPL